LERIGLHIEDEFDLEDNRMDVKEMINELKLCYITCPNHEKDGYVGALLLTDNRARPLHFAYASPVRPTKMQRILYGATLDEHLRVDVIAQKLLEGIPCKPDVLLVDAPELLAIYKIIKKPVVYIFNDKASNDGGSRSRVKYKALPETDDGNVVKNLLEIDNGVDMIEPFDRMREAIKEAIRTASGN
jgi:hypothetical protein